MKWMIIQIWIYNMYNKRTFIQQVRYEIDTVHADTDWTSFCRLMRTKTTQKERLALWKAFFNQGRKVAVNKRGYWNTKDTELKRLLKEGYIVQKREFAWHGGGTTYLVRNI